ncbi:MAG: fibronectin type III domain-containing protein [Gemmatimonadetes bacterium]|nr:fibronectin type III domain-containing protein [Gemmatimonadota bacterium]
MRLLLTALSSLLAAGAAPAPDDPTTTNPPNIIGLERVSVAENSSAPIATYTAGHALGDSIAWSLAGRDAAAFTFTTDKEHQTMTLFFRAIPDYEQPADIPPTDNDYQVSVVATAPGPPALATPYPVRVQVVDVEESSSMPVLTAPEQTPSTQAESVGGMVRAVVHFYKDVVGWAVRGVLHHLRDVFNASKRDAKASESPDAPTVAVYAGAWSALETSGRLHVSVGKPASAVTGYEYQLYAGAERLLDWTTAGVAVPMVLGQAVGAMASFAVGGLQHGQPYAVAVRAVNEGGASDAAWGLATPGRLFAPDGLQAVAGDGWVVLTWSAAASAGPVLTGYEWRGRPVWGAWSAWEPVAGGAAAREHTVEGLTNGVECVFEVRAANPAGAGTVAQVVAEPTPEESSPL